MSNQKKIWIFGATGFIGQALFSHLSANAQNLLFVLFHRQMPFRKYEACNVFTGSLSNFDREIIKKYPPDVVFHLARFPGSNALSRILASQKAFKANQRLVEILESIQKQFIVVYVSGSLMYGPQVNGNTATEETPLNPVAFAKYYIRGELPWLRAQEEGKLDIRFARPGWIVGPSSWFREFFWNHYLKTGKVPYYGDGNQLMSLVGLTDCVRLINLMSSEGAVRQNLNIFTIPPIPQKKFAEALAGKLNAGVEEVPLQHLVRMYGKTVAYALTTSIPLTTGFTRLYQNFRPLLTDLDTIFENVLPLLECK